MKERFGPGADARWRFLTDRVMGGVSTGNMTLLTEGERRFARMSGRVSTANRGGFIQMRRDLDPGAAQGATGVRLRVRGNACRYFVHLRTSDARLPWQYYQAGFEAGPDWMEARLPFAEFHASGGMLPVTPEAGRLTSLGIVAYGRDHDAEIDVAEVGMD